MRKLFFATLIIFIFSFFPNAISALDPLPPKVADRVPYTTNKPEFRGVWITTYTGDVPPYSSEASFKSNMCDVFEVMEHYKLNAMIFHIRTHNNALYKSELNPVASWWKTVDFDKFDPLAWLIDECHKRGIEFHAWMNPYRLGNDHYYGSPLPAANPQNDKNNVLIDIFDPGIPAVREFLIDTVMEVVENYDVDAIHFDDYFYRSFSSKGSLVGPVTILDDPDQSTFETYAGNYDTSSAYDKADWRREQVNLLIEGISKAIKKYNAENNRHVQFGISPTGIYRNGNGVVNYDENGKPVTTGSATNGQEHYASYLFADSLKWISEGWLDYILPQSYWATDHNVASYYDVMGWWDKVVKHLDVNLYSGIGIYQANEANRFGWMNDDTELYKQLDYVEASENIKGVCFYAYKHLKDAHRGSTLFSARQLENIGERIWREKKLLPEIKSMTPVRPGKVKNFNVVNNTLTWDGAENAKFYLIYRSKSEVTFADSQIIAVTGGIGDSFVYQDDANERYSYGVRAISHTYAIGEGAKPDSVRYDPVYYIYFYADEDLIAIHKSNETFELPAIPEKEGYDKVPPVWSVTDFSNITSDTRVDAIYFINEYEIKFYDKAGELFESMILEHGEQITPPDLPAIDGYEFKGWDTEIGVATSDMEIRPIYEEIPEENPPGEANEKKTLFSCKAFYLNPLICGFAALAILYLRRRKQ